MSELALNPSLLIYLIRHGETQYNRQNRFNGRTDSPSRRLECPRPIVRGGC